MNVFKIILGLIGGLAIFLYGIGLMSEALKKSAGSKMRNAISSFTKNRFTSLLTGIVSTVMVQSSSAVSVMAIGLMQAEIITFAKTFGILLGSAIGTTITIQIISFNIAAYSLVMVALGFFMKLMSNSSTLKNIGGTIFGFGLLFFGMHMMSDAMAPLKENAQFHEFLINLKNPFLGIFIGLIGTVILQSGSAFLGLLIVLASQGLITLDFGICLMLGSNIGSTSTAFLASIGSGIESKRVAVTFLFIKIVGLILICFWIPTFADVIRHFTSHAEARQIANSHTLLSIMMTVVLLPFAKVIPSFIVKIVPESKKKKSMEFSTKYLDDTMLSNPAIALSLAKNETVRMSSIVKGMVEKVIDPFIKHDGTILKHIMTDETNVDYLRQSISDYITKISQEELHDDQVQEAFRIMYTITELEEIGDVVSDMLVPKAEKWIEDKIDFSEDGKKEILEFHTHTIQEFDLAIEAFEHLDQAIAHKVKKDHKKIKEEMNDLKLRHFERLSHNIPGSVQSSRVHMELIGSLKGINSHSTNIGKLILHMNKDKEKEK